MDKTALPHLLYCIISIGEISKTIHTNHFQRKGDQMQFIWDTNDRICGYRILRNHICHNPYQSLELENRKMYYWDEKENTYKEYGYKYVDTLVYCLSEVNLKYIRKLTYTKKRE